jgi:hypothetical protein
MLALAGAAGEQSGRAAPEERPMPIRSFEEFWPFYIGEHRKPATRVLHYIGTAAAYSVGVTAVLTLNPFLIPVGLVAGYGPAWFSHFVIEKNKPASFKHPLYSFLGDAKMLYLGLTGRMGAEFARLEKQGFRHPGAAPEAVPANA